MTKQHIVVIDGYNVINRDPAMRSVLEKSLEQARMRLARLCGVWMSTRKDVWKFKIVFDGSGDVQGSAASGISGVDLVFHSKDKKADSRVIAMSSEATSHYHYTVVSDDNEVIRACRRNRAAIMTADDFLAGCRSVSSRAGGSPSAGQHEKSLSDKAVHSINRGLLEQFESAHKARKTGAEHVKSNGKRLF